MSSPECLQLVMLHVQHLQANNNGLMPQAITLNILVCVPCPYHHFFDFQAVWSSQLVSLLSHYLFAQSRTCRFYGHVGWHHLSAVHLTFPTQHIHKMRHTCFICKIPIRVQKQAMTVDFVQTKLPTQNN